MNSCNFWIPSSLTAVNQQLRKYPGADLWSYPSLISVKLISSGLLFYKNAYFNAIAWDIGIIYLEQCVIHTLDFSYKALPKLSNF